MNKEEALHTAYIRGLEEYSKNPEGKGSSVFRWAEARQTTLEKRSKGCKDLDLLKYIPKPPLVTLRESPIDGNKTAKWLAEINKRMKRGGLQPLEVYVCEDADKDGEEYNRVFAHTNHKPQTICLSSRWSFLPPSYALGILVHEAGHEAAFQAWKNYDEEAADCAAFDFLGCEIWYAPPSLLQVVVVRDQRRPEGIYIAEDDKERRNTLWG